MRVFVAGATGVLGRPLVRALVAAGHFVAGSTRHALRVPLIEADGGRGFVCDALDRTAVHETLAATSPDVVIHQLTALPTGARKVRASFKATNRLRTEGTRNLVDAAIAAGARRVIAESVAFLYEPAGPRVVDEDAPVWRDAPGAYGAALAALQTLERTVLGADGIEGVVLRYGYLYGPATWWAPDGLLTRLVRRRLVPIVGDGAGVLSMLHVDDAATATVRALDHDAPGVYNVTDDDPASFAELLPVFASLVGAKPPRQVPVGPVRLLGGRTVVALLTAQRGASNAKAKAELGWTPRYSSWREGLIID